jgi:hypothetical protein
MKFLEKLYIEELNSPDNDRVNITSNKLEDGSSERVISIDGTEFIPSAVLADDEDAFNQSFLAWINERKEANLTRANEILAKYENEKRFEKLILAYGSNNITPFVGAGMTIPSNYPGWTSFLYELLIETSISKDILDKKLEEGDYEGAAQLIHDDLGASSFNEHLEIEFSRKRETIGAINYLPELFKESSVITTNFDPVLENLFNSCECGFDSVQSGKYLEEIMRQSASGSRMLIKLHGDAMQVSGRVLTSQEYQNAYTEESQIKKFFDRYMFKSALLFMGCSLTVDRTIRHMQEVVKREGEITLPRHFAFLEEIKDDKLRRAKKKYLADANIFPIWYPEGEHDQSIEALFVKLLNP